MKNMSANLRAWQIKHKLTVTFTLCPYDPTKLDTIEHQLFECEKLQCFWNNLFTWLYNVYGLRMNVSTEDIIFGILNENNDKLFDVFNYCILFAKDYIYNAKTRKHDIVFNVYRQKLLTSLETEQFLANSQNKLDDFYSKWNDIISTKVSPSIQA